MSELSIPQQGVLLGDAVRAPYDADEFSYDAFAALMGFGRRADFGVMYGYDNGVNFSLEVTQTTVASPNVEIKIGAAMVRGTVYINDATLAQAIAANGSGQTRIDTVVVRKDYTAQTVRVAVVQGAPAASPVPPTLTQSAFIWEIPLANITLINGTSNITDRIITSRHQFVNVGNGTYVDWVLNDSGQTLTDGDVVIWKSGVAKAVAVTTVLNHWSIAGVWRSYTANGGYGRIQTKGFGKIHYRTRNLTGGSLSTPLNGPLVTGDTVATATHVDFRELGLEDAGGQGTSMARIGYLLESTVLLSGSTLNAQQFAYIDVQPRANPATAIFKAVSSSGANAGTFTSGSWVARAFNNADDGRGPGKSLESNYVALAASVTFTLQPGRYRIRGYGAGYRVDGHLARLQDTTNAATIIVSQPAYSPSAADSSQTYAELETFLVVSTATNYQFQQRCTTTRATDGLGKYVGFATEDVCYALLEITRLDDLI